MVGGTRNDDTPTNIVEMLELDSPGFVTRGNVLDFKKQGPDLIYLRRLLEQLEGGHIGFEF